MRKMAAWILSLLLLLACLGCEDAQTVYEASLFAMDTVVTVRLSTHASDGARIPRAELEAAVSRVTEILFSLEQTFSRTRATSDTASLNRAADSYPSANADLLALTARALSIAEETDGAYSPTLGALTSLWNISGGSGYLPTDAEIAAALAVSDYHAVTVTEQGILKNEAGLQLDFGGIAKGYAAAQCVAYLRTTRCAWGLLSLGGNVGVFGEKPDGHAFQIGVKDPFDTATLVGTLSLSEGFVAVSGGYDRCFSVDGVLYHHIFDPKNGMPASSGLATVAVVSSDGTLSDALSTALFVMGADGARAYYSAHPDTFEAILVDEAGNVILTPGLMASGSFTAQDGGKQS